MTLTLPGLAPASLAILPGETVVIVGKPGTGKSTLAEWLVRGLPSVILYETKGDPDEQRAWEAAGFTRCLHPRQLRHQARAMLLVQSSWYADHDGWKSPAHPLSMALEHPFGRVPTALLFDEPTLFPASGGHPGTHRLLQQGRSRGHVPLILTQIANHVDTRLLRLAQHLVVLGPMSNDDELTYLRRATGADIEPLRKLRKREVAWWQHEGRVWTPFLPIVPGGPLGLQPLVDEDSWPYPAGKGPRLWWRRSTPPLRVNLSIL